MKSLLSILSAILDDAASSLAADTRRDLDTILSRAEHEGDAFLYITLPTFGTWLENSLDQGRLQTSIYRTFKRKPKSTGSVLPCFLQGLTRLVFDEDSGIVRKDANETAIFFIRQICYLYKKPKALASPDRVRKALESYVKTDSEVFTFKHIKRLFRCDNADIVRNLDIKRWITEVSRRLLPNLERHYLNASTKCLPRHGPGATADKLRSNAKYNCRDWLLRWDSVFFREDIYGNSINMEEDLKLIPLNRELPVKVIPVPKTYKTSRIISVEPTAMQFAQQYVMAKMIYAIDRTELNNVIKFSDQSQNRNLALVGSRQDGNLATIDLSEASDRVGSALVKHLLSRYCPTLCRELFAVRSSHAHISGFGTIPIRKYASMGSATTFPVESLVFAILSIATVASHLSKDCRSVPRCVAKATTLVSVFGDDIIIPKYAFREVCDTLTAYGLKVNLNKSFAQGLFRESCGGDYYNGVCVTPVYCRTTTPRKLADAEALVSFVSLSNQLFHKGCWKASSVVRAVVEEITGPLPLRHEEASYLGWSTFSNARQFAKYNKYFTPVVRSYTIRTKKASDSLSGYSALLKHLISKDVQESPDHLSQSVRRHSVRLRREWVAV